MTVPHDYNVDISRPVRETYLGFDIMSGDGNSHVISATITSNGTPVTLTTAQSSLYVKRPGGATTYTDMTNTDNVASGAIPTEALAYEGRIFIYVRVVVSGEVLTVLNLYTTVRVGTTSTLVDPGEAIPPLETLLAQIGAMEEAAASVDGAVAAMEANVADAISDVQAALDANAAPVPAIRYDEEYPYSLAQMAQHAKNAGIKYATMPTAGAGNLGLIVQYVGATDTYTKGHMYECVSTGGGSPTYSWEEVSLGGDPNSVSFSVQTGKTDEEKAQARANVGLVAGLTYVDPTSLLQYGYGIISGCEAAAQGTPNQTVNFTGGTAISPTGKRITINSNATFACDAANGTNPRYDIIYAPDADADGVVDPVYLAGTAASTPTIPSVPGGGTYCTLLYRAANDNAISSAEITNIRRRVPNPTMERTPMPVTASSNVFTCDMVGRDEKYFQFFNTDTSAKQLALSNVNGQVADAYFEIKATATAAFTYPLDGRAVVWEGTALATLTSGYSYSIHAHWHSLVSKWILKHVGTVAN